MNTTTYHKLKILVVDDDLELNTSFALLLEFDGHEVQTAYTGEAALAMLAKSHFDLLISEYWLPRMRGDELAMSAKQQSPGLPIILITANFAEMDLDDHPIAGVDCLLDKPFTMDALRNTLSWVLGDQQFQPTRQFEIHLASGIGRSIAVDSPRLPAYRVVPAAN